MKTTVVAVLLALATPALASDYGYHSRSGYAPRSYYRAPRREVTTITPLRGGGTRIETRRYYSDKRGGRVPTSRYSYGRR